MVWLIGRIEQAAYHVNSVRDNNFRATAPTLVTVRRHLRDRIIGGLICNKKKKKKCKIILS
jgi:hypothetical protein